MGLRHTPAVQTKRTFFTRSSLTSVAFQSPIQMGGVPSTADYIREAATLESSGSGDGLAPPEGWHGMQPLIRSLNALTRASRFAAWKWDSSEYNLLDVILTNERNEHMTSARKAEANRQNALKSTGPRTPEGKAAVRLNALRHGLLSEDILLPGEDEEALRELAERLRAELQPVGSWRLSS